MKVNEQKMRSVARGICFNNECVLLVKANGNDRFFLPGGGINNYESASKALEREIREELNVQAQIQSFIGIVENSWQQGEICFFETNFIFEFIIPNKDLRKIISAEANLSFEWIETRYLDITNLKPSIMKEIILQTQVMKNKTIFWHTNF